MFRFRRFLPTKETIRSSRWVKWLGPAVQHPRLWHLSRRGMAMGIAIGIFFGLLFPIAQIPLSAAAAVLLRANLPAAVASTLVSNPATFAPIYYFSWKTGRALLGGPGSDPDEDQMPAGKSDAVPEPADGRAPPDDSWLERTLARVKSVGRPLLLGLALLAVACAVVSYVLVSWIWVIRVQWRRRRRRAQGKR
jgi:uncharacterized protein (DUF2062 family)